MRHATKGIAASTLAQLVAALLCKEIAARNETDTFFASQLAEDFVIVGQPTSHPTRPPPRVPTSPPISRPTAAPRPPDITSFRLRLTWKKGYMWQEKSSERFWCMSKSLKVLIVLSLRSKTHNTFLSRMQKLIMFQRFWNRD